MPSTKPSNKAGKKVAAHKYERIYALGPDRVSQMDAMLFKGTPAKDVARFIQNEWKEYTDVKLGTLAQQINRYNKEVNVAQMAVATGTDVSDKKGMVSHVKKVEAKFDTLQTLRNLVDQQSRRLNKIALKEQTLPTVLDTVRKEITLYAKLLDQLATLEMDLGILQRIPRKIAGNIFLQHGEGGPDDLAIKKALEDANKRMDAQHQVFQFLNELAANELDITDAEYTED